MSNKASTRKDIFLELRKADIVKKTTKRTKTLNKHNSNVYLVLLLCLKLMLHNIVLAQFETASILVNTKIASHVILPILVYCVTSTGILIYW